MRLILKAKAARRSFNEGGLNYRFHLIILIFMFYVYLLKSVNFPDQKYIGCTDNLKERLEIPNSGGLIYTKPYKPWIAEIYLAFQEEKTARAFEKYLKSGAGRAFAKKRFW